MGKNKNKKQETAMNMEMEILATPEVVTPEYLGKEVSKLEMDYSELPVIEQQAFKCRDKMLKAVRDSNRAFMDLASGLLEAFEHETYYDIWGCNFVTFAEQQLGIDSSRAYMLKDIAAFVRDRKIPLEEANFIGWTKMNVIVSGVKKNNTLAIPDLLEKAKELKVRDLKDEVKRLIRSDLDLEDESGEGEVKDKEKSDMKVSEAKEAKFNSLKLALVYEADNAKFVEEAITYAANELNLDTDDKQTASKAISHICESWVEMKNITPAALEVGDWIKFIKKKYGVTLVRSVEEDSVENVLGGYEAIQEEASIEQMIEEDDALKDLIGASDIKQ